MEDRIRQILEEKVNPRLLEHRGYAILSGFKDGVVTVRMEGSCATCPDALITLETIVKTSLRKEIPEIKDVILDHSADDEMIDIAKRILHKEISL